MNPNTKQKRQMLTAENHKRWSKSEVPSNWVLLVMVIISVSIVLFAVRFINWELTNKFPRSSIQNKQVVFWGQSALKGADLINKGEL